MDPDSALLPTDAWLKDTLKDIVKTNTPFRKAAGGILGFSALGLGALAGTVAASVMLFPSIVLIAAVGAAAGGLAAFAVHKVQHHVSAFKTQVVPSLKETIGKKYLAFKTGELKAEWLRKQQAYRAQKEAEKKAALQAAQDAQAAKQREAEQNAARKAQAELSKTQAQQPPSPSAPVNKDAPAKKEGGIRGFGNRLLQNALKSVEDNRRALEKPPAPKQNTKDADSKTNGPAPKSP